MKPVSAHPVLSALTCAFLALLCLTGTANADLPPPQGGYGSYSLEFGIGVSAYSTQDVMAQLNSDFDGYFPFRGCGRRLELNEVCRLQSPVGSAPVRVIAVEPTGFALRSLPGHPEGSGRTITFEFRYLNNLKIMHVNAWGPVGGASLLGPFNSGTVARESWRTFAQNIATRFPARPPCSACA